MQPYRSQQKELSFAFGAVDIEKSQVFVYEGQLRHLLLKIPTFTNPVDATISFFDANGELLYSEGPVGVSTSYNNNQLLSGLITTTVNLSGVPGVGGGTVGAIMRLFGIGA